jgi:hypothetical protein
MVDNPVAHLVGNMHLLVLTRVRANRRSLLQRRKSKVVTIQIVAIKARLSLGLLVPVDARLP